MSYRLGINFENLPGNTLELVARDLVVAIGNEDGGQDCEDGYLALLDLLKDEREKFYDSLFVNLTEYTPDQGPVEEALARACCDGHEVFVRNTKTVVERTLGRVGLEHRVSSITIIFILLTFGVLAYLLYQQVKPDQMIGDFNIAVAPFYVEGAEEQVGEAVANSIYGRLQANFGETGTPNAYHERQPDY